jgi:RNA polymerase sigma factor (sigma-70 family)
MAAHVVPGPEQGMAGSESDENLMTRVAEGDQRAFRILMGRHMGLAIRVAQRVVGDAAEADDIGQDAFLRVWSRATSYDPRAARFTTWLYRVVLNLSLDRVRKPAHAPIDDAPEIRSDDPEPVADDRKRAASDDLRGHGDAAGTPAGGDRAFSHGRPERARCGARHEHHRKGV